VKENPLTRFERRPEVEAAPMQEEMVLFHPGTKKFCVLNPTAAHLWERLQGPCTEDELTASLLSTFGGVEETVAARDVRNTLQQFTDLGIISITGAA
jgi:PqqD family protein of HPr-rel-A system